MKTFSLAIFATLAAFSTFVSAKRPNFEFTPELEPNAGVAQMCITFNTVSGFYYTFKGPWEAMGTGYAPASGSMCVPTHSKDGGAMFIGPNPNPGPGSTILECFFHPDSGEAVCNVSLVDGYSVPIGCVPSSLNTMIGGTTDLYASGIPCPNQQGVNCVNTKGYAGTEAEVDAFFQQGTRNGNAYCIWKDCAQIFTFKTSDSLVCSVGGA